MEDTFNTDLLVQIITGATQEVFSTMLSLPLESQPPYQEQSGNQKFDGVISLVGVAGSWLGSGRMSCSSAMACKLSGAFLMSEFVAVNEDVLDAIAEITNMIIGNVKSALEEHIGPLGLSIPTVVFGRNYQTRSHVAAFTVVPFVSDGERLEVRFAMTKASNANEQQKAGLALNGA